MCFGFVVVVVVVVNARFRSSPFPCTAADQSAAMQQQMSGNMGMGGPMPDMGAAFTAECDALEVTSHSYALKSVDSQLVALTM